MPLRTPFFAAVALIASLAISGAKAQSWDYQTGPGGTPPLSYQGYNPAVFPPAYQQQPVYSYSPPPLPPLPAVPDAGQSYIPPPTNWNDLPCTIPGCRD